MALENRTRYSRSMNSVQHKMSYDEKPQQRKIVLEGISYAYLLIYSPNGAMCILHPINMLSAYLAQLYTEIEMCVCVCMFRFINSV